MRYADGWDSHSRVNAHTHLPPSPNPNFSVMMTLDRSWGWWKMAGMAGTGRPSSPSDVSHHAGVIGGGGGVNRLSLPLPLTACHRCDVCGKLLSTKLTLKRHKEQQHLQPLNNAVCNLCHKVFRTLNSLNNHKSIYHRRQKLLHHGGHHGHGQHPFASVSSVSPLHHPSQHALLSEASGAGCDLKHNIAKLEFL